MILIALGLIFSLFSQQILSTAIHYSDGAQEITLVMNGSIYFKNGNDTLEYDIGDYAEEIHATSNKNSTEASFKFIPNDHTELYFGYKFDLDANKFKLAHFTANIFFNVNMPSEVKKYNTVSVNHTFSSPLSNTFVCTSKQTISLYLLPPATTSVGTIKINSFQMSLNATGSSVRPITHCDADYKVQVLVPLVVGGVLAGLIVIILITFIVIRSKARREDPVYEPINESDSQE